MGKKFYSRKELRKEQGAAFEAPSTSEEFGIDESIETYDQTKAEELSDVEESKGLDHGSIWIYDMARQKIRTVRNHTRVRKASFLKNLDRVKLVRFGALGVFLMVILGTLAAAALFAWYARDLPTPDKIVRREGFSTKLLDRKGELLYEVFVDEQRTPVRLDEVPETLKLATIAIEDQNFYSHGGFDPKGIARGFYLTIFTGRKAGGSTLTQQLVKNVLLTSERTVARKIKEFILAVQIESKYNKDEILTMYLNEAPYGGTAWGAQAASQLYFNKDVSELDLVESAILAGMPQRPSYYTPFGNNPEAYIPRSEAVLRRMREDGYIDSDLEASAAAQLSAVAFHNGLSGLKAPHFSLYVKQELEEIYGEELVEKGGLVVTTSLDYELQKLAETIVAEEIAEVEDLEISNGAAMVIDSNSGEILSMVGSKDFFADDYDGQVNVVMSQRQPGSAIKPVTYATAFAQGYTPAHMLMDVRTEFPSGTGEAYVPVNYDGAYRGPVQLRFALGSSLNVPAVKLLALVGVEEMLTTAYEMGFTTLEPTNENMRRFGLAVTLGGGEVRLIDLVSAYSAFSNGGVKTTPISVLKVEDRDGKVLFEHQPVERDRVLDEGVAFLINHVLSDNNARLLTFGANSYLNMGDSIAVKTGTTNDKRDNWTIGWTDQAVVGVWVGNNDNSPMRQVASGVTGSSPIWRRIMVEVNKSIPPEGFSPPGTVEATLVDLVSGYPAHDDYPSRSEYVIRGTLPPLPDPVHTKLKICRGQDKLASEVDIARGNYDEKEFIVPQEEVVMGNAPSWMEGIRAWAAAQEDQRYRPPTEYCNPDDNVIVGLDRPENEKNYEGNEIEFKIRVITSEEIDKVDILVNGSVRETLTGRPYESKIQLSDGKYEVKARARLKNGKEVESGTHRIGVGGVTWDEAEPESEPTPSPTNTPVPSPTPDDD
jgi:penicillin-binding protein 1C